MASGQVAGVIDDLPSCAELVGADHEGGARSVLAALDRLGGT